MCGKSVQPITLLRNKRGEYKCVDCYLAYEIKSMRFVEYWLKYKIKDPVGKRHNQEMLERIKKHVQQLRDYRRTLHDSGG